MKLGECRPLPHKKQWIFVIFTPDLRGDTTVSTIFATPVQILILSLLKASYHKRSEKFNTNSTVACGKCEPIANTHTAKQDNLTTCLTQNRNLQPHTFYDMISFKMQRSPKQNSPNTGTETSSNKSVNRGNCATLIPDNRSGSQKFRELY